MNTPKPPEKMNHGKRRRTSGPRQVRAMALSVARVHLRVPNVRQAHQRSFGTPSRTRLAMQKRAHLRRQDGTRATKAPIGFRKARRRARAAR